ncbi:XkdQ/YqbQ family protein [Paenibacillus ginsengarvi]|uniref:YqbQ/XkdQ domain-containing protein n=1 Tax=Paenibacillus ginsengarvi TaxID=400777 RepID=A0A3B0CJN5_9BACL|nr:hypothetical protein [Paenibacillus ginsengarvi]RKN85865.1 hypothetical protein D7M11_05895 [Paenibacillus ginsengarvi]
MLLRIGIDNKNGNVWDISGIVTELSYQTSRWGKASVLEFTILSGGPGIWNENVGFTFQMGDIVSVRTDAGEAVFYGFIFTIESGSGEETKFTAYDQLRYLMNNYGYVLADVTATQVVQQIAADFQLSIGNLADTKYVIPTLVEDNQKLMDIICKALTLTVHSTGELYVLYDDFGSLTLQDTRDRALDIVLGDTSLLYDFTIKRSIDDSANSIILYRQNKETGKREAYPRTDDDRIRSWGLLQLYEELNDEKMNKAQIEERLTTMLALKSRAMSTFQINAIGDIRVRAGVYIWINIAEIGVNLRPFLVNECKHSFSGNEHTMRLELEGVLNDEFVGGS